MAEKRLYAEIVRELTATADYRKGKAEIAKLQRSYSKVRHIRLFKPDDHAVELFKEEGFTVERDEHIKDYVSFKISW